MLIGDYLLKSNKITQKQREKAELEHELNGKKFGRVCLDLGFITRTDLNQALKAIKRLNNNEENDMSRPTEIGENTKITADFKFLGTIGAMIISVSASYFSITGQIEELKGNNSPNRLEHDHLVEELNELKSMGDLSLITYKLEEYKANHESLKALSTTLQPLATDLTYIKNELTKLKNKKIDMPDIDLSGIDDCKNKLDDLNKKIQDYEERLKKVEKNVGGRF